MSKRNGEIFEQDIEYEYRTKRSSGEQIDIDEFLDSYNLGKSERERLVRSLKKLERSMNGFEEYYRSIDFDSVFREILKQVEIASGPIPQRLNAVDELSWSVAFKENIKKWLNEFYQSSIRLAAGSTEEAFYEAAALGSLPVEILDGRGNRVEEINFQLKTDIKLSQEGELVFSAVAPDDSYSGEQVLIKIEDEEHELIICSSVVDANRHIDVFSDLSFLGEGVRINRYMIKAQLAHSAVNSVDREG